MAEDNASNTSPMKREGPAQGPASKRAKVDESEDDIEEEVDPKCTPHEIAGDTNFKVKNINCFERLRKLPSSSSKLTKMRRKLRTTLFFTIECALFLEILSATI